MDLILLHWHWWSLAARQWTQDTLVIGSALNQHLFSPFLMCTHCAVMYFVLRTAIQANGIQTFIGCLLVFLFEIISDSGSAIINV